LQQTRQLQRLGARAAFGRMRAQCVVALVEPPAGNDQIDHCLLVGARVVAVCLLAHD
jgi:hypothetical protein